MSYSMHPPAARNLLPSKMLVMCQGQCDLSLFFGFFVTRWLQRSKNDQFRGVKVIHYRDLVDSISPAVSGGRGHCSLLVLGGERLSALALRLLARYESPRVARIWA